MASTRSTPVHDGESLEAFNPARLHEGLRVVYTLRQDAPGSPWRASASWQVRTKEGRWQECYRAGELAGAGRTHHIMGAYFRAAFQLYLKAEGLSADELYDRCLKEASTTR